MINSIASVCSVLIFTFSLFAQTEILHNHYIIEMTNAGLSDELIVLKIRQTAADFETTAESLIELKKAGVTDQVISEMMAKAAKKQQNGETKQQPNPVHFENSPVVIDPEQALKQAKTIAIKKDSLQPSIQALEKEILKRNDWQKLDLNLVRYKQDADLLIEITYVNFSWITHRYSFRVYDNKSATIIAAGETTSWGSLAENLAREISKKMNAAFQNR